MDRRSLVLVALVAAACQPQPGTSDSGTEASPDVCAPVCSGRVCGSNGCGGVCGLCEAGSRCDDSEGQCVPALADAGPVATDAGPAGDADGGAGATWSDFTAFANALVDDWCNWLASCQAMDPSRLETCRQYMSASLIFESRRLGVEQGSAVFDPAAAAECLAKSSSLTCEMSMDDALRCREWFHPATAAGRRSRPAAPSAARSTAWRRRPWRCRWR